MSVSASIIIDIASLVPHPLQPQFYRATSASEQEAFLRDLAERGQQDPIHILPPANAAELPSAILDGHRRCEGLKALGKTKVLAAIRHDLKDATRTQVDQVFLSFNFQRRSLSTADRAKIAIALAELRAGKPLDKMHSWIRTDLLKKVAGELGMSKKTLDRYHALSQTPPAVQAAFHAQLLTLVTAASIATLRPSVQEELARDIGTVRDKAEMARIVRRYRGGSDKRHVKPAVAFEALTASLQTAVNVLASRPEAVNPSQVCARRRRFCIQESNYSSGYSRTQIVATVTSDPKVICYIFRGHVSKLPGHKNAIRCSRRTYRRLSRRDKK